MDELPIISSLPPVIREALVRILVLCVALLLIYFARRALTLLLLTPLQRLSERAGRQLDKRLLDAVFGSVRLALIAIALLLSAQILAVGDSFFFNLIQVFARSLIIIATLTLVYRLVDIFAPTGIQLAALTGLSLDERLIPFLRVLVKLFIIAIGLVIILQELGYDVTGLIAGIGVGGLAISLAAQDTIANLFGFASIVGDRPFNVGDYIKTTDIEGTVEHVGVRSTRLRQMNQTQIIIPNNVLANSAIFNFSRMGKRRVDIVLPLADDTPSQLMRALLIRLRSMLNTWPTVEQDSVQVFFNNFGEHSFDVMVRCYVDKITYNDLMSEQEQIQLSILEILEELRVELSSQSIFIENMPTTPNTTPITPTEAKG
jgi:MscS family membrane protein